ncbi:MAG: hypothetical protein V4541_10750 [Bacteroidota bacterium]
MNKQICNIILCFLSINFGYGQNNQGARLTAMGNNGAAVKDAGSVEANPAGIPEITSALLFFNYQKHFFISGLSAQSFAFLLPIKHSYLALNLQRYGISEYHQFKAGLIYTRQFGAKLAIGLRGNYHQLKLTNYGNTIAYSIDLGAIYEISEQLCFGIYLNNLSAEQYHTKLPVATLPTIAHLGIAYQANDNFLIATTIKKALNEKTEVAVGIDYRFIEAFSLRGGISLRPIRQYFGLGFTAQKILIDFALLCNPDLRYLPQITVSYAF